MDLDKITANIDKALEEFTKEDKYLLENNACERSMAHRIACFLENGFPGYDVDCEYNINIESESGKKCIYMIEEEIKKHKETRNITERDFRVFPDIIIHERGVNSKNLVVFEIKKEESTVPEEFDKFKLEKYTDQNNPDGLKYKYGVFVKLMKNGRHIKQYYSNGNNH